MPPPQRKIPQKSQAKMTDVWFPILGLDVSVALERQLPDTTPGGVNVRAFEHSTDRARGGSRSGLSKYIDQSLPLDTTADVIQHLQVVVDPRAVALAIAFPPLPGATDYQGSGFVPYSWPGVNPDQTLYGTSSLDGYAPPPKLTVLANDEQTTKDTPFVWAGTEYTYDGLLDGDSIGTVDFDSEGADATVEGTFPIIPSNAQITLGNLTWTYTASNLPPGLSINASSGMIVGIVNGPPGVYQVTMVVSNQYGDAAKQKFNWTVNP